MGAQVAPASSDRCHCSVGVGVPDAADVNDTGSPARTELLVGCVVIAGAIPLTVSVAALDGKLPYVLVYTMRNLAPLSLIVVAGVVYGDVVAPEIAVQVEPPSLLRCHCP